MLFKNSVDKINLPYAKLSFYTDFLSAHEAEYLVTNLLTQIPWRQDSICIAGKRQLVPRLHAWYGDCAYSYSGIDLQSLAWTTPLLKLKNKIENLGYEFNSILANLYRNGCDSVSWHADDESELGENAIIASYSLGATRRFEIKAKRGKHRMCAKSNEQPTQKQMLELAQNSLLIMHAPMQNYWLHQVPKQVHITAPRINLTFRYIYA